MLAGRSAARQRQTGSRAVSQYSRGKKLVIPYTITPASPLYASYDGSTFGVYIKFCVYVYLTEEDMANEEAEPYYSKEYTVVLKRLTGLQESGAIDVLLKLVRIDRIHIQFLAAFTAENAAHLVLEAALLAFDHHGRGCLSCMW